MSRGFGSTFGTDAATDVITGGTAITPATNISISAWLWRNGFGPSGFGTPFAINPGGGGQSTVAFAQNGDGTNMYFHREWDNFAYWTFTNPTGGAWFHLAIVYDGSSTANLPVIYINGSSVSVTIGEAPTGTLNNTAAVPTIGNFGGGDNNFCWDGIIAGFALWNGALLTVDEVRDLVRGACPILIKPHHLALYAPLDGINSPEPFWPAGLAHGTVTGSRLSFNEPSFRQWPWNDIFDAAISSGANAVGTIFRTPIFGGQNP
jgi:hypothetical protein